MVYYDVGKWLLAKGEQFSKRIVLGSIPKASMGPIPKLTHSIRSVSCCVVVAVVVAAVV